jgi:hypothetical protein
MASQSQTADQGHVHSAAEPDIAATLAQAPAAGAVATAERPELKLPEPGEQFGDYLIVRTLGRGGMGAVYEAEQQTTARRVALKVLKHSLDSPEARKRFLREGRLAASINHPNSVYVFGTEEIDGTPAIAMELVAGGTLQERVKQQGPLPVGEAVDIILQIIAGLEAAQRLGVLHRDIKPANCFVDASGVVKVGDFGLSISTVPRAEADVTQSGSFLGTPAFASPEQLRGDELNLRSDMYSVGVTLYYLLTGRTPFNADNLVRLLATVLEQSAESPKRWRAEIPQGLAQLVLRCLEKQPTDRFKTYDELRQALLPFASTAPLPAPLGLRLAAYAIDRAIWVVILWCGLTPLLALVGVDPLSTPLMRPGLPALLNWFATFLLMGFYFAVPEGRWGLTLGKYLCRLRVVNQRREPPGIAKALVRAWLLAAISAPEQLGYCFMAPATFQRYQGLFTVAQAIGYALLFATARQRNGLAGVHDLLTGTRVIVRLPYQARTALELSAEPLPATQTATIGPYHVLDVLESAGGGEWILGYDARLLRRVWIRKLPSGTEPTATPLRNIARPGRLRWLNGKRSADENWDAYEALTGRPLVKLLDRRWPWESVRFWLLDLAEELDAAAKDGTLPESLGLDCVWITAEGRAKLFDFAPPGLDPLAMPRQTSRTSAGEALDRRRFLNQLSIATLEGRVVDIAKASTRAARVPLPIAARSALDRLAQPGGDDQVAAQFAQLVRQSAVVSRRRRLAVVLACCLPAVFLLGMMLMVSWLLTRFSQTAPDVMPLYASLTSLERLQTGKHGADEVTSADIQAVEVYIAHRYGKTISDPDALAGPIAQGMFDPAKRRELARIVAAHPHPSSEEVQATEKNKIVQEMVEGTKQGFGFFQEGLRIGAILMPLGGLSIVALLSLVAAIFFRRGLVLRTLGVEIVTANGRLASRGRTLWRCAIAWSPLLLTPIVVALMPSLVGGTPSFGWLAIVPAAYLPLVAWSLTMPGRGLHDRLAGTWLVPA